MNKENSMYAFYLGVGIVKPIYSKQVEFGKYHLHYSKNTNVQRAFCLVRDLELILLGDVVDLRNKIAENLAEITLSSLARMDDLLDKEYGFGGKYVIFFRDHNSYYVLGDATSSVPVFYINTLQSGLNISSNPYDIVRINSLKANEELLKIRNSSDISQAMPYDITEYSEIMQILPNSYIEIEQRIKKKRYPSNLVEIKNNDSKKATEITVPLIRNLLEFYNSKYEFCCPLTGGKDSRVVLAFMLEQDRNFECFTLKHDHHIGTEQDLTIPRELTFKLGLEYEQVRDKQLDSLIIEKYNTLLKENRYSLKTVLNAETIKEFCQNKGILNGDIMGQVGKISLHRDIPEYLATPYYFQWKIHNYSKKVKPFLKEWLKEIKLNRDNLNKFDLFSIENRLGRWAAQENLIYNLCGQIYLNIFNSRSIIYPWCFISRKERKNSTLHITLIDYIKPELLDFGFESERKVFSFAKSHWIIYYFSSFIKYKIEKFRFYLKGL